MLQNKYIKEVWELVNSPSFSLSFSSISALLESPLEFYVYLAKRHFYTEEETAIYNKETEAMKIGKVIDAYIFDRMHSLPSGEWCYFPEDEKINGATKEGKLKRAILAEKYGVPQDEYEKNKVIFDDWIDVQNMHNSIKAHAFANELIFDSALAVQEKIRFCSENGIWINCKIDVRGFSQNCEVGSHITDLKKMTQANKRFLGYNIFDNLLHLQGYIYTTAFEKKGINIDHYFIVVVCANGALNVVRLKPKHLEMGKELFDFAMYRWNDILCSPLKELSLLQSHPPKQGFIELV